MQRSTIYKWAAGAALAGALAFALTVPGLRNARAANLTSGSYTFMIKGEEAMLPVDPIAKSTGMLLPLEAFQQVGITVDGALDSHVTLTKDPVVVQLNVGSPVVDVSGKSVAVGSAPIRVSGRLFLPAELLKEFGVEYAQDGQYITMRPYTDPLPTVRTYPSSAFADLKRGRTVTANVKADSAIYLSSEFTVLTPDLIKAGNLPISEGMRARLLSLLDTNTLVLGKVSNQSVKAGALVTAGLYLVDSQRNVYEVASVVDIGKGMLNSKLPPGGDRLGVLVYPKLADDAGAVSLYYEANGQIIGSFAAP